MSAGKKNNKTGDSVRRRTRFQFHTSDKVKQWVGKVELWDTEDGLINFTPPIIKKHECEIKLLILECSKACRLWLKLRLLCPQVGPSQPSLQMQVKVSPPPTQVPPLEHGLEAHVLFLAGWGKDNASQWERESKSLHHRLRLSPFAFTFHYYYLVFRCIWDPN